MRQRNEELEAEVTSLRQQLVGTNAEVVGRQARLGRERGDLAAQVIGVRRTLILVEHLFVSSYASWRHVLI